LKLLQDAAAADEKVRPASVWSWVTGSGRDAAIANANAAAPGAYFDLLAKRSGAESGALDVGQTLEFLNRYRATQGLKPIDESVLTGGSAPTSAPAPSPMSQAPAQPSSSSIPSSANAPAEPDQVALFSRLAANAVPSPAPTLPTAQMTTNAPAQPDQGALFARLAANAPSVNLSNAPPANPSLEPPQPIFSANGISPPTPPNAPINPLEAQRAFFARMGSSMAGLPKYANTFADYLKLAQSGLTPELGAVALPDGRVVDALSGQPVSGDVNSRYATRAGQVATAQAVPHVAAENAINDHTTGNTILTQNNQANLERGTNSARVAAENAYKPPVLMRAPDGSIVGVTPGQMAQANGTGALTGYRPLTEEDTKALGAFGEQYAKDQATLPDVRNTQNTIRVMLDQAKSFPPGTFGDVRASAGRILTGLGADPDQVAKVVGNPAGADVILKNTLTLAMQRLKQNFGQSREAGFIVEKTMQANPNIATQPEAYSFMLNTMNQEAQRQADYLTAQQQYRTQHGTLDGFAVEFDRTHPVAAYANQAMLDTYGVPPGSVFLGRSQGKPVFQSSNGKKFMVTQ
jgi:hypothetical protein